MPEPASSRRSALALQIIEGTEDAFVAFDGQFRFLFANPAAERLLGMKEAELLGRSQWEAFPATIGTPLETGYRRAMDERVAADLADFSEPLQKWYNVHATPSEDGGLEVRFRDITEHTRAVEAVRSERQRFGDALDQLPACLVLLSPDYHVPFANRFFRERFGEANGRRCYEYLFQRSEPCEICETYTALKTNAPHRWEWTGPDGRNYDIYDFPFTDADGSSLIMEVGLDITERRRAEAELARHRDHLEELVRQRTTELESANAQLARSNQELEQFAYVASHDLQEPLRGVTGYLGLIEPQFRDKLDDRSRLYFTGAIQGAARMHMLITDLLALSRVGTHGQAFEPADLDAVLDQALDALGASVRESGARITRDPLPTLRVDTGQIAQLFQNLIGNALKFRGERLPEIHISAQTQPGRWVFAVSDNGIGIKPQYFERIFMIFQRLHTRQQYPGTGIGLALCKKIVERHGGTIWVESQAGEGSTFCFTIPEREIP